MATRQSSKSEIDDIWKFLDHEEPDDPSIHIVRNRLNSRPSKEFLKPAAYRSSIVSMENQQFRDDIQLPTFAQKYSGNVLDGSLKHSRSPFRLPRPIIKDEEPIYGIPKKLPRSNGGNNDSFYDQGFSGSLFKRYEAGSILSTVSSEHPPVVYHDSETLVREDSHNKDNVVFSKEDLYSQPHKQSEVKRQGNASARRCKCCSRKVIAAVIVVVFVVAAVIAIAVGVSVSSKIATPSEVANTQGVNMSLSRSTSMTYSISIIQRFLNSTRISVVATTSPLPFNINTNPTNSTSASANNNSTIEVSVSTPPSSRNSTSTNGTSSPYSYVIFTNSTSSSQKNTTSETITEIKSTPSDSTTARTTTTNTDGINKTSATGSNSWTSSLASLLSSSSTAPRVPVISSSPQAVTTSLATSNLETSTTSVKISVTSFTSIFVDNTTTSSSINLLTAVSANNSVGVARISNASTTMTASTSITELNTSSAV